MFSPSDSLIVFRQNNADQHTSSRLRQRDLPISPHLACEDFDSDSDTEDQIEDTMDSLRLRQLAKAFYYVCSFRNLQGQIDSNHITLPTYGRIGCMENNMNGLLAISYVDRTMTILHMDSLNVLHNFKLVGSGSIGCLEFINNHLYFAPSSGILVKFDVNQPKITGDVDNLISNEAFKFVRTHAQ